MRERRWAMVLMVAGVVGFALVAGDVVFRGKMVQLDEWVARELMGRQWSGAVVVASVVTQLGSLPVVAGTGAIVGVWLAWRRRWREVAVGAGALVVTGILGNVLKWVFAVPRPGRFSLHAFDVGAGGGGGYSFPSGHAMGATVLCGLLALVIGRRWGWVAAGAIAPAVSAALVYIGVHTVTEVIAGMCVGMAVVGGAMLLRQRHRLFCHRSTEDTEDAQRMGRGAG